MRKHSLEKLLNAMAYIMKTGCQWNMIPPAFGHWKAVYHHFRSWSERGCFATILDVLAKGKRAYDGRNPEPSVGVVDSQSVRSALPHSQKGIDGHKRIKGIKRHIMTDSQGWPLSIHVTTANVHDSKAAYPLIANGLTRCPEIRLIKGDKGYGGALEKLLPQTCGVVLECVKSNFGTPDFIPMKGRWVVERTFSWLETSRRLTRNYEKLLKVARGICEAACMFFMLRYFR